MRHQPVQPGAFLVCVCCALGCAPTETGNPSLTNRVSLTLQTSDPDQVAIAPDTAATITESFWLGVGRLRYYQCSGEVVELLSTPRAMELVSGMATQAGSALPPGSYCSMQLVLSPTDDPKAPTELVSYGLFVTGSLSNNTKFQVLAGDVPATRTLAEGSLDPGPDSPPLLLTIDVAKLLTPLSLHDLPPDASGVVLADRSGLTGDPQNFGSLLSGAYSLHEDLNGNGRVDADEPDLFVAP